MGGDTNSYEELRIHGVSGTPPESTLELAAVPTDPLPNDCGVAISEKDVQVYKPPEVSSSVRAFRWGSLTSGAAITALWILLLPFMLANVAGWALLPVRNHSSQSPAPARPTSLRWITLLVRLTGLVITAIYAVALLLTFADLIGYQGLAKGVGVPLELGAESRYQWAPGAGVALAAGVIGLLFWATKIRPRDDAPDPWEGKFPDDDDPVGYVWLDRNQDEMWNNPGIIVRLRRLHLAGALALIALVAMETLRLTNAEWGGWENAIRWLALLSLLLPVLLIGAVSLSHGRGHAWADLWIRWVAWMASTLAVAGATWRFMYVDFTKETSRFLPAIRGAGAWIALTLLLLVIAAFLISLARRDPSAPASSLLNQSSLLLTAATVATIYGIGVMTHTTEFFGEVECQGADFTDCKPVVGPLIDWLSIGFTWMLTVVIWFLAIRFCFALKKVGKGELKVMRAVRAMTDNISKILGLLATVGAVGLIIGLAVGLWAGFGAVVLPWRLGLASGIALAVPLVAALVVRVALMRWPAWIAFGVAAAGVTWFVWAGRTVEVAGITLPPQSFVSLARALAVTIPTSLVIGRILGGLRSRETRRGVGVLWDLGTFWPRWFHPFAPPTYSDKAVTRLTTLIDGRLFANKSLLLAPHSQGSIIAAASVLATTAPTRKLAMITYGSPLSRLYARAFPAVFTQDALVAMSTKLADGKEGPWRWRNLFRKTDPIGGAIGVPPPGVPAAWTARFGDVDKGPLDDPCERKHSDYPKEQEYRDEAAWLRQQIVEPSP